MEEAQIRRATLDDAAELGFVAPVAYAEAYAYLWDRPQAFLRHLQTFGEQAFRRTLASNTRRVWVALLEGRIAGFLSMNLSIPRPDQTRPQRRWSAAHFI